jgi:hypothetical protein
MSLKEGKIFRSKLRHFKKLALYLRTHKNAIALNPPVVINTEQCMYNAGIILLD